MVAVAAASQAAEPEKPVAVEPGSPHPAMPTRAGVPVRATGKVIEKMDAGRYTYVLVDAGDEQVWAAGPHVDVEVGDEVTLPEGSMMSNHYSPTLDKSFESIYFVAFIMPAGAGGDALIEKGHGAVPEKAEPVEVDLSGIAKPEGGKTVGEIFDERASLAGQEVTVRGRVVKFTPAVMGKNWIHLRDGTKGKDESNDLTVTSDQLAEVGNTVLVRGVVAVDRDLGFGYHYEVLVEDASISVE
jgi:hypothetical protein